MQKTVKYVAGLIGLYLVVAYATGSGSVIEKASAGGSNFVKALQGRG